MDLLQIEQKIRQKSASAEEYSDYLNALNETDDALKNAQACCCFF